MKNGSPHVRWIWAAMPGVALICISAVAANAGLLADGKGKAAMPMILKSPSFAHGRTISARHTCDGPDISPPLAWSGVPADAKSLALIVDDPDAPDPASPKMTWVHWVLYNIPITAVGLAEGIAIKGNTSGILQGLNDWQRTGYGGPCPPIGEHRYFFKLYALDVMLPDLKHPTKAALEKAMQGHVLAKSELIGLYRRK